MRQAGRVDPWLRGADPMTEATTPGPLAGLKVLEAAAIVAGPYCGRMLADLGADVVKIERYPKGDDTRAMMPPDLGGEGPPFLMLNRNKRSIVVNLRETAGQQIFRRLARTADVVIENNRRGVFERLGIGFETLRADNPGLIYCAISGFGRTGPYADRGGYDLIAQAMSGLMAITGEAPGRPPVKVAAPIADFAAGLFATIGVLAAYAHRQRTGEGQAVDASLFEAGIAATFHQASMYLASGEEPQPMGSAHPFSAPYQAFEVADGWITIGAGTDTMWPRLCAAMDLPELADDPRFRTVADRNRNLGELVDVLAPEFRAHTSADWLARLETASIPAGPVQSIGTMLADPQVAARDMLVDVGHTKLGQVQTLGTAVKLDATPPSLRRGAPLLGEHTAEVLGEAGYDAAEIDAFAATGVVVLADGVASRPQQVAGAR